MAITRPLGPRAAVLKYDLLTALGAHGCAGDKARQRLVLRLITLVVARYNWQSGELTVGQREIAALWGVDERTVKRDLARLRGLGWLEVRRPAVRGRVAVHGLRLDIILAATRADWDRVGPDFAGRMGASPSMPPPGQPADPPAGNVISFPQPPRGGGRAGTSAPCAAWSDVAAALQAESPALYAAWFAPLAAEPDAAGGMILRAPSRFHAAFVRTHHLPRLREMLQARDDGLAAVEILA